MAVVGFEPAPACEVLTAGGEAVLLADGFFSDPSAVRREALAASFARDESNSYPGRVAPVAPGLGDAASSRIRELVREHLGPAVHRVGDVSTFNLLTPDLRGVPPILRIPHVDSVFGWAGLVYLNLPDQCHGGTALYRQRDLDQVVARSEDEKNRLYGSAELLARVLAEVEERGYIHGDSRHWELLQVLGMRFNRLVVYPSRMWHAPYGEPGHFDESVEGGRLTMNCFLKQVEWRP